MLTKASHTTKLTNIHVAMGQQNTAKLVNFKLPSIS